MSILTHKMKTARKDYLGDNCKLFFPFNGGSGAQVTDIVGGVKTTFDSATHNVPHAITGHQFTTGNTAPNEGTIPTIPKGKHIIALTSGIIPTGGPAFGQIVFGQTSISDAGVAISSAGGVSNKGIASTSAAFGTLSAGDKAIRCFTFNNSTGELRTYSGISTGSVSFANTTDASAHIGALELTNSLQIGNNSTFVADWYVAAILVVNSLPSDSDLTSMLDWTLAQNIVGHKVIHPDFAKY